MTLTSDKLNQISSDLELIKFREGLKAFRDLVFFGLKLKGDLNYEDKTFVIYNQLDNLLKSNSYDKSLVKKLKSSIYSAYNKLSVGNHLAHAINLNSSILDQLFEKIKEPKNDNNFNGLKEKFKSTKAEKVLKDLIYKRRYLYHIPEHL